MGPNAGVIAACLDGAGVPAEALALPTRRTLKLGRRHTSGKECLPMIVTLGSLLERLEQAAEDDERLVFFMPSTRGPCRFGVYYLLHRIVLERLGLGARVRLWSPLDESYFEGLPAGFSALVLAGFAAMDALLEGLHHVRPVECRSGAADEVFERGRTSLLEHLRQVAGSVDLASPRLFGELTGGSLLGLVALVERFAAELTAVADGHHSVNGSRAIPSVALAGEIYLRCDPFSNESVIERLEERGLRVHLAPFTEWLEYADLINRPAGLVSGAALAARLGTAVRRRVLDLSHHAMGRSMGWPRRITAGEAIRAARPWVRPELHGEAILTVGTPLEMWRQQLIDGVVTVAPLECMPGKIAEAQLVHASRAADMPLLALSLHGEPIDPEPLDAFAFDAWRRLRRSSDR
jgi:predicted nucleotide-binding protein (sugar kinase/HSP70/actin superfamily)